jgi:glycosyltransferase involved in cell wall biosynthesis
LDDITVITANFKTPTLLKECVTSFLSYYPAIPYVLIDNGGCKDSLRVVRELAQKENVTAIYNPKNVYHGPALNQGIRVASTPYVFTLDSDTRVLKGGFLELMKKAFEKDPLLFAIGWLRYVGPQGVATPKQELKRGMKYVHPYASMLDRARFLSLPVRYIPAGSPATKLMHAALKAGYHLESFPVEKYIWHKIAGTRGRFGGEYLVPTDRKPTKWRKHRI